MPAADPNHGWYPFQEHPELANDCRNDSDCFVGGCAAYSCTADPDVFDVCRDAPALAPIGASCGCIGGECIWWRRRDYAGPGTLGQPCVEGGYCIGELVCEGSVPGTCGARR